MTKAKKFDTLLIRRGEVDTSLDDDLDRASTRRAIELCDRIETLLEGEEVVTGISALVNALAIIIMTSSDSFEAMQQKVCFVRDNLIDGIEGNLKAGNLKAMTEKNLDA